MCRDGGGRGAEGWWEHFSWRGPAVSFPRRFVVSLGRGVSYRDASLLCGNRRCQSNMFVEMNHGPITVYRLLGSTIRRGIIHVSVAEGPGVAFCVEHRHAQLDNVLWHCLGMAAVDMCIYRGTDLQTKVRAPSPAPDVISCCAVICTCDKVGTPGTYICRIRGRSRARASRAGYAYRPPSHSSPPSPSRSG